MMTEIPDDKLFVGQFTSMMEDDLMLVSVFDNPLHRVNEYSAVIDSRDISVDTLELIKAGILFYCDRVDSDEDAPDENTIGITNIVPSQELTDGINEVEEIMLWGKPRQKPD